jgi:hypothetical protein
VSGAFKMAMDLIAFKAKRKNECSVTRVFTPNITKRNFGGRKLGNFPCRTMKNILLRAQTLKSIRVMTDHS